MKYLFLLCLLLTFHVHAELNCENPGNTLDINQCLGRELEAEEKILKQYLEKGKERYAEDSQSLNSITASQEAWLLYRQEHCGSVFAIWRDGSIRGVKSISCRIRLTRQRTHEVWQAYLTFMDSTPPLLPEPNGQSE